MTSVSRPNQGARPVTETIGDDSMPSTVADVPAAPRMEGDAVPTETLDDVMGVDTAAITAFGAGSLDESNSDHTPATDDPAQHHRKMAWRGIRRGDGLTDPVRLLSELALDQLLSPQLRRALRAEEPIVVILVVPSPAWVAPVEAVVKGASLHRVQSLGRATRQRMTTGADPDGDAADRIAAGRPVVAVVPDVDFLSPILVAAADHILVVQPLDAALVTRAIGLWCGRKARAALAPDDLAGLDLLDVGAALRAGAMPTACLDRIRRASRFRVGPKQGNSLATPLDALTGYGAAHDWALATVTSIAAVRRGEVSADVLEGVVFYGPPGTGKTTLARALAASAGVTFVETNIGQWFADSPGYLDSVIKQAAAFADQLELAARRDGIAVGFIDEIDALGNRLRLDRGASFWTPLITFCLTRFEALRRAGVVLIAATNDLDRVDRAFLRPGRFDLQILIGPPDETGRLGILRGHLGDDLDQDDLAPAARLSSGMTGAVLAGCVRSARNNARAAKRPMILDDLLAEIAPADRRPTSEVRAVALHEAGHAVVACRLGLTVVQVSIQAGDDHGGKTVIHLKDRMPDRLRLEHRVIGLLSGRAADAVLGAGVTVGAATDLRESTRLIAAAHVSFGLDDRLSAVVTEDNASVLLREDPLLAKRVEADLQRLLKAAEDLVRFNRNAIEAVVDALLRRRVLTGDEICLIVAAHLPRIRVPAGRSSFVNSMAAAERSTA